MADEWKGGDAEELREQDRFLPIANISRIMKKSLPDAAKIAKDAKETVQECVSEFICFITSEASDKCQQEKRKTINGEDILWAMSTLGFDKYVEPLKLYLAKYRESVKGEKPEKKPRREEESGGGGSMAAAAGAAAAGNSAAYAAAYAAAAAAAAAAASSQPAGGRPGEGNAAMEMAALQAAQAAAAAVAQQQHAQPGAPPGPA